MTQLDWRRAVFITADYAVEPQGGGVQRCTREYVAVAEAAGFCLQHVSYTFDRRLTARLRRRLRQRPYQDLIPAEFVASAIERVRAARAGWVFFNQIEAAQLAPALDHLRADGHRFALLSHGVDSSDQLHTVRLEKPLGADGQPPAREALWLGRQLFAELGQHRCFDVVFCLSETDRLFAQWLGAASVHVLPRLVTPAPLDWQPCGGRIGTVGTLVHAPNREGLDLFCRALVEQNSRVRLRLVGRPGEVGRELAARYACIDYLGGLDDQALAAEAATWCAFVNPIFCYPRGCSTKLAVPLGWELPIATTRAGARGYVWDEALVPLAETPAELARLAARLAEPSEAARLREGVRVLAARSPTLSALATMFGGALAAVIDPVTGGSAPAEGILPP